MTSHLIPPDRRDDRWSLRHALLVGVLAIAGVGALVAFPPNQLLGSAFGVLERGAPIAAAAEAFGASGQVSLQVKLPGEPFAFPLDRASPTAGASYQWLRAADSGAVTPESAFVDGAVRAPPRSGFYHLAVTAAGTRSVIDGVVVAVLVPFNEKVGASLNGYRIGTYRWERARGDATPPPPGFVEVWPEDVELWVSDHLQLADFVTHDGQDHWPKYVALDPRVLDKVELVVGRLGGHEREMNVNIRSGFRTPLHNRRVPRAAGDSRHQYGDAVDIALDADGDGRVSYFDILAVARAVDLVERDHPELVGGMGVYGNRGNHPYVHIDVRGERKRWRG